MHQLTCIFHAVNPPAWELMLVRSAEGLLRMRDIVVIVVVRYPVAVVDRWIEVGRRGRVKCTLIPIGNDRRYSPISRRLVEVYSEAIIRIVASVNFKGVQWIPHDSVV